MNRRVWILLLVTAIELGFLTSLFMYYHYSFGG